MHEPFNMSIFYCTVTPTLVSMSNVTSHIQSDRDWFAVHSHNGLQYLFDQVRSLNNIKTLQLNFYCDFLTVLVCHLTPWILV